MQFLYQIRPTRIGMLSEGPTERETALVEAHVSYLQDLIDKGVVHLAGRTQLTDDRAFGIVVFTAESEAAAAQIVENDPAVREGVMRAELFPFRIALWGDASPDPA